MTILSLIGIIYLIYKWIEKKVDDCRPVGELDFKKIQEDTIAVNFGELTMHEYKRREKNGYYLK